MVSLARDLRALEELVNIGPLGLPGLLHIPSEPQGIVIFAHGSGSSRHSKRNQFVADYLHRKNIGTLLFDLLTEEEEFDRQNVFDIHLLAERLDEAKNWLSNLSDTQGLPFAYFGASTGAGAALVAAANSPSNLKAVVSRGGRPDLAGDALERVDVPTLLVVGGADANVIELNQQALVKMHCKKRLDIIPNATHLFTEKGALDKVAALATEWFLKYL